MHGAGLNFYLFFIAWVEEFRGDFTGGAEKLAWAGGEGKRKLTESSREFPKASTPPARTNSSEGTKASNSSHPGSYFFCGSSIFSPFLNTP